MCYIYILKSLKDNKLYVGSTRNLNKRIDAHNSGKVRSTKSRAPFKLIYYEKVEDYTKARKRESYLKTGSGRIWIKKNILCKII